MKRVIAIAVSFLCLSLTAGAQEKDAMLGFQLSEQLKKSAARWNSGDLDGFLQDYLRSEEMTFTSGGRTLEGFEALEERYRKSYGDSPDTMGTLSFSDFKVWKLGPEQALVLGRWRLKQDESNGSQLDEGVFSLVMVKVGDEWKILHDHTSAGKPK